MTHFFQARGRRREALQRPDTSGSGNFLALYCQSGTNTLILKCQNNACGPLEFMFFFQERSNIEKEYAKQLKQWSNKWESIIQKGDFSKYHPKGDFSSSKTASKKVGKHLSPLKRWKRGKHKLSEAFSFAKHCCLERRMHTYPSPQIRTSSGDNV